MPLEKPEPYGAWSAMAAWTGIAGAVLLAANVPLSPWGFVLFLISSVIWERVSVAMDSPHAAMMYRVYAVINLVGVMRWLVIY